MFYHPKGKPYVMTIAPYTLTGPKVYYHPMTVAFSEGGEELANADKGLTGYVWTAEVTPDNKVNVRRTDNTDVLFSFQGQKITQVDLTFDQNMRPFITYVDGGKPYYYHFSRTTSNYESVALPIGITFPRCELDMRDKKRIPQSDIILGYLRGGKLCYGVQRERFTEEHVVAEDSKKSMLWRVGKSHDGRFVFYWR